MSAEKKLMWLLAIIACPFVVLAMICPRYKTEECPANGGSACPTHDELADAEDNAWQIWEMCDS